MIDTSTSLGDDFGTTYEWRGSFVRDGDILLLGESRYHETDYGGGDVDDDDEHDEDVDDDEMEEDESESESESESEGEGEEGSEFVVEMDAPDPAPPASAPPAPPSPAPAQADEVEMSDSPSVRNDICLHSYIFTSLFSLPHLSHSQASSYFPQIAKILLLSDDVISFGTNLWIFLLLCVFGVRERMSSSMFLHV